MLFGSILGDLFGTCFLWLVLILWAVVWGVGQLLKSDDVRDGARFGIWYWFFSDDD